MRNPVREQLITDHLPLVRQISRRLYLSWGGKSHEIHDLCAYGARGLIRAADRFDATRGVTFESFARIVIEGAIRDGVRGGSYWFGRRAARSVAMVHLDDVAPGDWEDWLGKLNDHGSPAQALWNGRPMFQPAGDGDRDLGPVVADEVERLPSRERRVIHLCFYQGKQLTEVAREMGVQLPWVSRLRRKALLRLRTRLDGLCPFREVVRRKSLPPEAAGNR
jgi:RNA polymerase sigma factor for flagellar operon FliA